MSEDGVAYGRPPSDVRDDHKLLLVEEGEVFAATAAAAPPTGPKVSQRDSHNENKTVPPV